MASLRAQTRSGMGARIYAMHPTADQIRAAHGWPRHVYVSEEAEALRLRIAAIRRRLSS
ncbi:MAG: hypothetical protein UY48_C0038G0005 [Candidatus Gottesmanbacteria bacterium GW2011_GWB1_49_7]|uniref:Uncharacterized protein n=1 Tax=Candidatus Gottesmanbacteria bacterium GW2011_GWB1_49_7 TaxID=1618448 RepID=A0A0G1VVQ6_9BACT|nr:MAG: hypothetical protein UY48_C0038G0005 [Candidatus Gottesmanbacteria bacterium GW2011_GWB1_49_7]